MLFLISLTLSFLAQERRTLQDWLKAVPAGKAKALREGVDKRLREADRGDDNATWRLGLELADLADGMAWAESGPVFLTALRGKKGRQAGALLYALNVREHKDPAALPDAELADYRGLLALAVGFWTGYVTDPVPHTRLCAVTLLANAAEEDAEFVARKGSEFLSPSVRDVMRKALTTASKDADELTRRLATAGLANLPKK